MVLTPEVGNWYKSPEDDKFEVVAYESENDFIEVQFYDGTIGEYDLETWAELHLVASNPPEDWSGSLDVRGDDYGVDLDRPAGSSMYMNPLDDF